LTALIVLPPHPVLASDGDLDGTFRSIPALALEEKPSETRAELYDPALGTFSRIDMATVTGSKAEPLFDGRILIAGGFYTSIGELYDPTTNTVEPAGYLARPYPVVDHDDIAPNREGVNCRRRHSRVLWRGSSGPR
jgi:hypothetical protein